MRVLKMIKQYLTDKDFRYITNESIFIWCLSRRFIVVLIGEILARRYERETKGMSSWEAYKLKREYMNSITKWGFHALAYNLLLIVRARDSEKANPDDFAKSRDELLNSELIDEPRYSALKSWLIENNVYETADLPSLVTVYDTMSAKY